MRSHTNILEEEASIRHRTFFLLISGAALLMSVLGFAFVTASHPGRRHPAHIEALMAVRYELALAHLRLDEMRAGAGHRAETDRRTFSHLDTAVTSARSIIEGGETPDGPLPPVDDASVRQELATALEEIAQLRSLTTRRLEESATSAMNPVLEQQYETEFAETLAHLSRIERALRRHVQAEFVRFRASMILVSILGVALLGWLAYTLWRDSWERVEERTALARNEAMFRGLLDNSSTLIFLKDPEGKYLLVNRQYEQVMHVTNEAIAGKTDHDIFPGEVADGFCAEDLRALKAGGPIQVEENVPGDDGLHTFLSVKFPVEDADGEHLGVFGISTDISDRKRAEEELLRHQDHLEELVEERTRDLEHSRDELRRAQHLASIGTLAAGIAHEINNPLGIMMLNVDLALRSLDEPTRLEQLLRENRQTVERCERIVKGVLQFARDQSTERRIVDLNDVVRRALDFTHEYVERHGVSVETHQPAGPHPILANSTEMEQVCVNLIHNAVHACSEGGLISIETSGVDEMIRLVVRDDGCGMTAEQTRRAFDPFFTTRMEKGGTGLGLSTAHGIVTAHGGKIAITSKEGNGTTLTLDFPPHAKPRG